MGWERLTKKKMGSIQQSAKETLGMVAEERAEKETAERDIYTKQDRKDIGSLGREERGERVQSKGGRQEGRETWK